MWSELEIWQKIVVILFVIVGLLALAVGFVYLAVPAKSLPHFFPAYAAHSNRHGTKHAIVAFVAGVVLLAIAVIIPYSARRSRY